MQKIFGIGFHKTATKSLAQALEILGYKVTGPNHVNDPEIKVNAWSIMQELIPQFDAFQDNPWPLFYRQLNETYKDSKFILTLRDSEAWYQSVLQHFGGKTTPMRNWIYGNSDPSNNKNRFISCYEQHNEQVIKYFQDKPEKLLILNITDGDGWDELCGFLGKEKPRENFPFVNSKKDREVIN